MLPSNAPHPTSAAIATGTPFQPGYNQAVQPQAQSMGEVPGTVVSSAAHAPMAPPGGVPAAGVLQAPGQPAAPGIVPAAAEYYYPRAPYQYDPYYSNLMYSQPMVGVAGAAAAAGGMPYAAAQAARLALPTEITEEEPVYVNAKQYHCILRRRQQRAKAEAENKLIKTRRPYLHQSRHNHATRRIRGAGGRFLTAEEAKALEAASGELSGNSNSAASSQPAGSESTQAADSRTQANVAQAQAPLQPSADANGHAQLQHQQSTAHSLSELDAVQAPLSKQAQEAGAAALCQNGMPQQLLLQPPGAAEGSSGGMQAPAQQEEQQQQHAPHHGTVAGSSSAVAVQ